MANGLNLGIEHYGGQVLDQRRVIELRIVNATEAVQLVEEGWPSVAVSLVGDDLRFPLRIYGPHHLILNFHDVEEELAGYVAPNEAQMRQALLHASQCKLGQRLLVHCHAGKSRSPALAIAILIQAGMSPAAAFEEIKRVRPQLIPNRLMIRQLDQILGLDGELFIGSRAGLRRG